MLGRVLTFRTKLDALLRRQPFELIHFRSTYEGYPLARRKSTLGARLLYEVNGLASIELKYTNPRVAGDDVLLSKLRHQEDVCLGAADRVVTVSEVNRQYLQQRGCNSAKIAVIPNGVDLELFTYRDPLAVGDEPLRILYCGTLSPWQGIEVLLEALQLVVVQRAVRLLILGPGSRSRRDELQRRAQRAGLQNCVEFRPEASRKEVVSHLHNSQVSVAPLTLADRNTVQGCCPLKLLEALAVGCPVIASDLPIVREIARPEIHYLPIAPDDPTSLALAILRVGREREANVKRSRLAGQHIQQHFRWEHSTDRLLLIYEELLATPSRIEARATCSTGRE
jgi:glycosyltransferase involved in cell wall biosynthesis